MKPVLLVVLLPWPTVLAYLLYPVFCFMTKPSCILLDEHHLYQLGTTVFLRLEIFSSQTSAIEAFEQLLFAVQVTPPEDGIYFLNGPVGVQFSNPPDTTWCAAAAPWIYRWMHGDLYVNHLGCVSLVPLPCACSPNRMYRTDNLTVSSATAAFMISCGYQDTSE
jgi:hypothetical protein